MPNRYITNASVARGQPTFLSHITSSPAFHCRPCLPRYLVDCFSEALARYKSIFVYPPSLSSIDRRAKQNPNYRTTFPKSSAFSPAQSSQPNRVLKFLTTASTIKQKIFKVQQMASSAVVKKFTLIFYAPPSAVSACKAAVFAAGAGRYPGPGNYTECCWSTAGTGQFRPGDAARPHIGAVGALEETPEVRVETLVVGEEVVGRVVGALKGYFSCLLLSLFFSIYAFPLGSSVHLYFVSLFSSLCADDKASGLTRTRNRRIMSSSWKTIEVAL
ncbi:hypothetical protein F4677DRAFT_161997 [Hypoxylon crocopeplum]|nr:hypothetical protein F4677DRAFT_161997 [Hypoxylon crocopeplum]